MKKVLYITANPKPIEKSISMQVGDVFLKEYQKVNPEDNITVVDLYKVDFPDIDYLVMGAIEKTMQNIELSSEEGEALAKRKKVLDQFMEHDKIIFISPMWEFGFPAILKKYLDTIAQAGVTFKYTEKGPVGLINGTKKVLYIQASGGNYSEEGLKQIEGNTSLSNADNFGSKHLQGVLKFMGIDDYTHIYIPNQAIPELGAQSFEKQKAEAIKIAQEF